MKKTDVRPDCGFHQCPECKAIHHATDLLQEGTCPFCKVECKPLPEDAEEVRERLEYLRGEIEAERISYGEIAELQSLADRIDPEDVLLLQWAGVPESFA